MPRTSFPSEPSGLRSPKTTTETNKSVFALGILLVELCISEPLSESQQDEGMAPTLFDDYQAALGRLDEVYCLAGNSYG